MVEVGLGMLLRRDISLYVAIRWRGVRERSRLGQLLSQNPHSMHLQGDNTLATDMYGLN